MRKEKDSIGTVKVPRKAYYGAFTQRALENFRLTGRRMDRDFIKSLAAIKIACSQANLRLGLLEKKKANAIIKAAKEVYNNKFSDQFPLDPIHAGAGTPINMNMNEVIANRANELMGGRLGEYRFVHPNDHANMSQSSNCIIPSAIRITCIIKSSALLGEVQAVAKAFNMKSKTHSRVVKVGRTHLQDAVPITFGQVFHAYEYIFKKNQILLAGAFERLKEINLGGSAIGTGINTNPGFGRLAVYFLDKILGGNYRETHEPVQMTQSMQDLSLLSSQLASFASEMVKICNDLIFLASGPRAGIGEIKLPEVEPGSSIMPGKVNPSIVEAFKMICLDIIGKDYSISESGMQGMLELNVMTPLIGKNLFSMIEQLASGLGMFRKKCINGLAVDTKKTRELLEASTATAAAFSPLIGYDKTSELVRESIRTGKHISEIAAEKGINLKWDPKKLTRPNLKRRKK